MDNHKEQEKARIWISRGFTYVEDVVYIGLGLLLAVTSISLLVTGAMTIAKGLFSGGLQTELVLLLDRILLILLVVEIMYTVQISFREHTLLPAPFLLIGLIAVTRRILVLTAELSRWIDEPELFRNVILELGVLTVMVIVLVAALVMLKKNDVKSEARVTRPRNL